MARLACGTIVAKSYLSFARALAESFHLVHPDIPFVVLLCDEIDGYFDPSREPFRLVRLADLDVAKAAQFRFQNLQQPLSYAATPYLLAYLLDGGFDRVLFIKQESLVLADLSPVFEELETASILLAPHLEAPLDGASAALRELNILQSGTFNVGMLGVSNTAESRRFLDWWKDRVHGHCRHAVADGMHYEQRWLDLVPAYFAGARVLRDRTCNVGHWNLPERSVSVDADTVLIDGRPCRLFRFSGFDPDDPRSITRYSDRLTWETVGPARRVFARFRDALERHGYHETKRWPYAYARFANDVPVPDIARSLYRQHAEALESRGDPFRTGPGSYFEWLNQPASGEADEGAVTRLWDAVYRSRPDLQAAFPDVAGADRERFRRWTADAVDHERTIDPAFLAGR